MKRVTVAVLAVFLLAFTGSAAAVPSIDGVNSLGEWTSGLIINTADPNEAGAGILNIPDDYDISRVAMIQENSGGSDDGIYVLIELYGNPTFTSLDITPPIDPVFYTTGLDVNRDGDFLDAEDRIFDFRATGFTVYDGSGTPIADTGASGLEDSVVEFFIPEDMLGGPLSAFDTFTLLDNAGAPADDRAPDDGFSTTIPEPTSMLLFGSGLLGALGYRRRKRNAS